MKQKQLVIDFAKWGCCHSDSKSTGPFCEIKNELSLYNNAQGPFNSEAIVKHPSSAWLRVQT
jgi:hypothetical protein